MANYAFTTGKALPQAENGQRFERCNFARLQPHTKIFEGITGLRFFECNLTNCDLPPDAVIEGTDCHGHIEYCGHVHPKWIEKGVPDCAENCAHVTSTDVIKVGGVTVETVYHHSDKVVA